MNFAKKLIPQKIKNIYHLAQAVLADFLYGFPSKSIKVIGVTGTNGKTTTVQMIARILEEAGFKTAVISTINFKIGDKEWVNKTKFTTLSSFAVQKFILDAVKARCEYAVLETSSHALDQYRVWGIDYDCAVITNITREHLDYHKTMEEYKKAKSLLFENLKRNFQFSIFNFQSILNDKILKNNKKISIVNLDMDNPDYFLNFEADEKYGYTTKNQNAKSAFGGKMQNDPEQIPLELYGASNAKFKIIKAENIELGIQNTKYKIQDTSFKLNLLGLFNVENALAAICVGLHYGINLETISQALEKIKGIPGRMEYAANNKGINIIIDYAVTPDSLDKLYKLIKYIREHSRDIRADSRVISVFGACGERDRGKRPLMGEIVSRYADYIILTNEDPYNEDPWRIMNELESGIMNHELRKSYWKIMDRREAIKKALQLARPGDFIVVTGKGAEETMAIGKKRIEWNDKKVIIEELAKL